MPRESTGLARVTRPSETALNQPPDDPRIQEIFRVVYPALRAYCIRLTGDGDLASDIAQEAFVRLVKHQIEGEDAAVRVWLYKVATHLIRDRHRVESNRARLLAENPIWDSRAEGPDKGLERRETKRQVRRVLDRLQPRDRELLIMRYGGFSYREIATTLDIAPASVGTLLSRAQRRFAEGLSGTPLAPSSAQPQENEA